MHRLAKTVFDPDGARGLNNFSRHTMRRDGAASYDFWRRNLHPGIGNGSLNTTRQLKRPIVFSWIFVAPIGRGEPARPDRWVRHFLMGNVGDRRYPALDSSLIISLRSVDSTYQPSTN